MTFLIGITERGRKIIRKNVVPTPPGTGDFLQLALSLGAVGIWPLADVSGDVIADATGTNPGQWVNGAPLRSQPTLLASAVDAYGFSTFLAGADRGRILHHASYVGVGFTVFVVMQPRQVATKGILLARDASGAAGGMSLEVDANGIPRAYLRDSGNVPRVLVGSSGAVVAGQARGIAFSGGAAGLKLYLGNGTPIQTNDAITDVLAGTSEITLGAWHAALAAPYRGLLAWALWFPTQLSNENVGLLMAEVVSPGVTWANPDTGTVQVGQQVTIDAAANDSFQGTGTLSIAAQGGLGSYSVVTGGLRYTAGNTAGTDTAGRYRVNGGNQAQVTVTVTPSTPSGATGTLRGLSPGNPNAFYFGRQDSRGKETPTSLTARMTNATNFYGLRSVWDYLSKYSYADPSSTTTTSDPIQQYPFVYNHTNSGIIAGANKCADLAIARYNSQGSRCIVVNIEKYSSINVPPDVIYDRAVHGMFATVDSWASHVSRRLEHNRFKLIFFNQMRARLDSLGYSIIEVSDYNTPRKLNEGSPFTAPYTVADNMLEVNNYQPLINVLDATGPQAGQLMCSSSYTKDIIEGSASRFTELVNGYANGAKIRIEGFASVGVECRVNALVWPLIFGLSSGPDNGYRSRYFGMRPGMMTEMMDRLWAVGVRRFYTWQFGADSGWTDTNFPPEERRRAHESYEELAAWITAKGTSNMVVT
jgi:hypothetical protein